MSNSKRSFSIALGSLLTFLLLVGVLIIPPAFAQGPMRDDAMDDSGHIEPDGVTIGSGFCGETPLGLAPGWMMGNQDDTEPSSFALGSMMNGMMGQMMNGMMGSNMMVNSNSPFFVAATPLTIAEATEILNAYLIHLDDSNLEVGEVMIFDNHAYAQIVEKDSGIGVIEVLVDYTSKAVFPEMGPNMMWNLKYGMMSGFGGFGMMGMMMGGFGATGASTEMILTPEQAVESAQICLDTSFSMANLIADEHADPFYGYYTLHINRDGETVGMLSVNGFTGEVFPHTWHGKLLEMSGE